MLGSPVLFGEVTSGVHGSGLWETGVVGEEVAFAAWSRSAKGGRKSPNERAAGEFEALKLTISRPTRWRQTQSPLNVATELSRR